MSCQPCCAFDVAVVDDFAEGGSLYYATQDYSFVISSCPIGVICPPGLLPQTVTIPKNKIPPVTIPPNPRILTLQGCKSIISVTVPEGASAGTVAGLAAGLQQQWAAQQAQCDLATHFNLPNVPPTRILPLVPLNSGCPGMAFNQTLPGLTGINPLLPVGVSSGSLPAGLTLTQPTATSAAILSGTPTTPGNYLFILQGTDTIGVLVQQPYSLAVVGISNIASVPAAMENTAYSFQLTGTGGTAPYTFVLTSGSLPGITISPSGLMSGTPNYVTAGSYPFTVKITDMIGLSCSQSGTLTVNLRPGPDWTQLVWSQYVLNSTPGHATATGAGIKNVAFGNLVGDGVANPTITPVAAAGVTYTGPSVTSRIILTISVSAPFNSETLRLFQSNIGQVSGWGGSFTSGTYTFDWVTGICAGVTFTLDDASPGNKFASIFGGAGSLSFTIAIVNV